MDQTQPMRQRPIGSSRRGLTVAGKSQFVAEHIEQRLHCGDDCGAFGGGEVREFHNEKRLRGAAGLDHDRLAAAEKRQGNMPPITFAALAFEISSFDWPVDHTRYGGQRQIQMIRHRGQRSAFVSFDEAKRTKLRNG